MKKVLLLAIMSVMLMHATGYGQAVPNSGFESWNSYPYNNPNGWWSGNPKSVSTMGVASVTKVTGQSGFGVRIETHTANGDTADPYISNTPDSPDKGIGGVPYSQQPTALTGYYRYGLPGNDSAGILVIFKKNAIPISENFFLIRGTGTQNTWASFSFPITLPFAPDTVIIAATSSNLISGIGIENGSFLELDGLTFAGTTQAIPGGDFENWTSYNFETPVGWETQGENVTKTTDNYSGTYAVRMETTMSGDGWVNPGGITSGHNSNNGNSYGGQPYTMMNDTLIGYYKYIPSGTDTANIYVNLSNNASNVGGGGKYLFAASVYTYFEVSIGAFTTPDTIRIQATSSSYNGGPSSAGSVLYLDDLQMKSVLTGIAGQGGPSAQVHIFPNPAHDKATIQLGNHTSPVQLTVNDVLGNKIYDQTTTRPSLVLNLKDFNKGLYFITITAKNLPLSTTKLLIE